MAKQQKAKVEERIKVEKSKATAPPVKKEKAKLVELTKKDKNVKRANTDEIDELFTRPTAKPTATAPPATATSKSDKKDLQERQERKRQKEDDKMRFGDPKGEHTQGAARRYTDDGLPIYPWEEIVSLEGGDTPDCPFDCACCY